jgi:hypothetical protein
MIDAFHLQLQSVTVAERPRPQGKMWAEMAGAVDQNCLVLAQSSRTSNFHFPPRPGGLYRQRNRICLTH